MFLQHVSIVLGGSITVLGLILLGICFSTWDCFFLWFCCFDSLFFFVFCSCGFYLISVIFELLCYSDSLCCCLWHCRLFWYFVSFYTDVCCFYCCVVWLLSYCLPRFNFVVNELPLHWIWWMLLCVSLLSCAVLVCLCVVVSYFVFVTLASTRGSSTVLASTLCLYIGWLFQVATVVHFVFVMAIKS